MVDCLGVEPIYGTAQHTDCYAVKSRHRCNSHDYNGLVYCIASMKWSIASGLALAWSALAQPPDRNANEYNNLGLHCTRGGGPPTASVIWAEGPVSRADHFSWLVSLSVRAPHKDLLPAQRGCILEVQEIEGGYQ